MWFYPPRASPVGGGGSVMHPLEAKIRAVRRRWRLWLLLKELGRLTLWVLGGATVFAAADYWFRFQDPGLRILMSIGFFALVGWGLYQFGRSGAWKRISEVALALRLERSFPVLADRLASSVSFLQQSKEDPTAGSPLLRELVIAQTTQEAAGIDFQAALDPRPVLRSLIGAGALGMLVGVLVLADPNLARIALARLAMPLGKTAWPQRTHLIIVHRVERIARGEPFELVVEEATGKLPSDLRIHYRLQTPEGLQEQSEPVRLVRFRTEGGSWKQVGQVRREGLHGPFWYRLTGGDDHSMEWIHVEVLEPPRLMNCQVRLIPPEYSGLGTETAGQWIRALVGTRAEITGRVDRPLRAVVLLSEEDHPYEAEILGDGYLFQIPSSGSSPRRQGGPKKAGPRGAGRVGPEKPTPPASSPSSQPQGGSEPSARLAEAGEGLVIRQSGRWRLRLIDQQGLEHEVASWEVRAVPDLPPSLTVLWPPLHSYATPGAQVPIRVKVNDDLGIRQVVLWATVREQASVQEPAWPWEGSRRGRFPEKPPSGLQQWVIYEGPSRPPQQSQSFSAGGDFRQSLPVLEYAWDLARVGGQPGMEVVFSIQAVDYGGQTASSPPHRMGLLRPEQFLERLSSQENTLVAELAQWLQKQRSVHEQLNGLAKGFVAGQPLELHQLERVRSLELAQRQLLDQLVRSPESILGRLETTLADLTQNHLGQTELRRRLEYLRNGLLRLEKEEISRIAQQFLSGIKAAQSALDAQKAQSPIRPPQALLDSLGQVLHNQAIVIQSLESWLQRFQPGLQTQRYGQQIQQLIREQKGVLEQLRQIAQTTLTKEVRELGPQELADLRSAAQRQADLAQRTEQLQREMAQQLTQLETVDPVSGQLLAEAVRYAEQKDPATSMATATQDILQNRMGRLFHTLPEILHHLEHLADLLGNRPSQGAERRMGLLEQTEQALTEYINRQQEIQSLLELASRAKPSDQPAFVKQAAAQQENLLREVEKLLPQMEHLWAAEPGQAIRSALEGMRQTVKWAQQGAIPQAIQTSQLALQTLQQARWLLRQERVQIQGVVLAEHLGQLRETLPNLYKRQEQIRKETLQLEDARKNTGTLNPQDQIRLADLARQQQQLHTQTHSWTEKLTGLPVFQMALAEAASWMQQAAQQLAQSQTGPAAQQAQQEALAQIRLLQEALQEEISALALTKPIPAQNQQPASSSSTQKVVSTAELKLLRLWQHSIHQRTVALYQTFGDQPSDRPEAKAQYQALRQAQARLAQMVQQILQPTSSQEQRP